MSAIKTPTYNLAKFLVPLLEAMTTTMYPVKNSFEFAKEIADQDPGLFMASPDVEYLFTNIPLEETRCVCVVILCLAMMPESITLTGLILKNF